MNNQRLEGEAAALTPRDEDELDFEFIVEQTI